jgi:hypothetical protein
MRIDLTLRFGAAEIADAVNAIVLDRDIGLKTGASGTIDNLAVANDDVVFRRGGCRCSHTYQPESRDGYAEQSQEKSHVGDLQRISENGGVDYNRESLI